MKERNLQTCSRAATVHNYLDGELTMSGENSFELHLTECRECAETLNEQKRLLCALELAFDDEKCFEMPQNFARSIAVRAESDVAGLRSKDERRSALLITIGLFGFGVLVGIIGKHSGILTFVGERLPAQIRVVAGVFGNFCYDFIVGFNVIWRMIGRGLILESPLAGFLLTVLLIISLVILFRLLFKFHRVEQSS